MTRQTWIERFARSACINAMERGGAAASPGALYAAALRVASTGDLAAADAAMRRAGDARHPIAMFELGAHPEISQQSRTSPL